MKILKIAVVGLGRIGWQTHLPEIAKHNTKFQLTAVVDTSKARLDEAKEVYGVRGFTDLREMISVAKPDIVVIASPTHLHMEHACTAMQMGCDVFLEKPMATDYASAKKIADCAEEHGRKLMVFQPRRISPDVNQLKEIIATGKIGRVFHVKLSGMNYDRRNDWQAMVKFGGGILNNHGAHYLDVLNYMFGEKVSRVSCIKYKIASAGDAEDTVKILMETENHIIYDVDISWAAAMPMNTWLVLGEHGAITMEKGLSGERQFRLRYYDSKAVPDAIVSEELIAKDRKYGNDVPLPWVEEIIPLDIGYEIDFYDKCYEFFGENKASFVPVSETLYLMDLIRRCRESSEEIQAMV